ncbi:hypothetical protein [Reichenbachiella sp.]|uniref:hypothetical protein n=1 Tax=Reichenbachiella sp. TaxID=2184521 RepID=UPI0032973253
MPTKPNDFEVIPFNEQNLAKALSNKYLPQTEVSTKKSNHFRYLLSYLSTTGLAAGTIVIESPYVSKSFLNDYASYYALCFEPYEKHTKRIHFFQSEFGKRTFSSAIINPVGPASKKVFGGLNYLGHIVAKPLPEAIIGPTLLRTFQNVQGRRYTTKPYKINLFGKKVKFDSLVFQEQDTVVSACATMATWVALHKASRLFETTSPTPNQITSSAGNLFTTSGRSFPNHGLDYHQIGNVLKSVGLVAELRNKVVVDSNGNHKPQPFDNMFEFRAFLYAYNKIGIPILLGIRQPHGLHLIAMTGFHIETTATFLPHAGIRLNAHRIEKIYVHDDQIGPFARTKIMATNPDGAEYELETDLPPDNVNGYQQLIKSQVISAHAVLHPKIRIQFEEVLVEIKNLDFILRAITQDQENYEWDIYLDFSNIYKEELRQLTITGSIKRKPLFSSYPKHIWVARLRYHGVVVFDIIFDSTAIARSFFCIAINFHFENYIDMYRALMQNATFSNAIETRLGQDYIKLFNDELKRY